MVQTQESTPPAGGVHPDQAAHVLRFAIGSEVPVDSRIMLALVNRAIEGAVGPGRTVLEKYAEAYRSGRRVKFGTGTTLLEGETPQRRRRRIGVHARRMT